MPSLFLRLVCGLAVLGLFCSCTSSVPDASGQDSGGRLSAEQAAIDITYYALDIEVKPDSQSIAGRLTATAAVRRPLQHFVLNLDRRLRVTSAVQRNTRTRRPLPVERKARGDDPENEVWMELPSMAAAGDTLVVEVEYRGSPRVAPQPPWDGGFTWAKTPAGDPWIATSCQTIGADVWWPVKDHPSDEPDSMSINVTLPRPLVAASNGRLRSVDSTATHRTYRWFVSTPINPYGVALHAAPYVTVDTTYTSTAGTDVPVTFYALPPDETTARESLPHFLDHVRFLEKTLGPYPFRADKYGIAQSPFKGMEHQSIIAYGNDFNLEGGLYYDAGFDALHFHELAHEWYGNLVTVRDWKDFWIHEGVATYLEALYREDLQGMDGYWQTIAHWQSRLQNRRPVARSEPTSAQAIYGTDVYYKGAMILHTLRHHVGNDAVREVLRTFAFPTEESRAATDGSQCRTVTTADFVQVAEEVSGMQLDGFFSVYLYRAQLPVLNVERSQGALRLQWTNTGGAPFEVAVPVRIDGQLQRVKMTDGSARLDVPPAASVEIDPWGWVLKNVQSSGTSDASDSSDASNSRRSSNSSGS